MAIPITPPALQARQAAPILLGATVGGGSRVRAGAPDSLNLSSQANDEVVPRTIKLGPWVFVDDGFRFAWAKIRKNHDDRRVVTPSAAPPAAPPFIQDDGQDERLAVLNRKIDAAQKSADEKLRALQAIESGKTVDDVLIVAFMASDQGYPTIAKLALEKGLRLARSREEAWFVACVAGRVGNRGLEKKANDKAKKFKL